MATRKHTPDAPSGEAPAPDPADLTAAAGQLRELTARYTLHAERLDADPAALLAAIRTARARAERWLLAAPGDCNPDQVYRAFDLMLLAETALEAAGDLKEDQTIDPRGNALVMAAELLERVASGTAQAPSSLPPGLAEALEEQQTRLWRLRSLLDALQLAVAGGADLEDEDAALSALVDLADAIHGDLDVGGLAARAAEIAADQEDPTH